MYNLGGEGLASERKPKQDEKSCKPSTLKETFFNALCSLKNVTGELGELLKPKISTIQPCMQSISMPLEFLFSAVLLLMWAQRESEYPTLTSSFFYIGGEPQFEGILGSYI